MRKSWILSWSLCFFFSGVIHAQRFVDVNADIVTSTRWTADNVYRLANIVRVLPGATLTIDAGTVIASIGTPNGAGRLVVTAGAQIFIRGREYEPVIFTSDGDRATWTNGDPRTGTWRAVANEWGGLAVLGSAYVSEAFQQGNVPFPDPRNRAVAEGLIERFPGDPAVRYGGGNDDDDSGEIRYVSIRYSGRVVALNNELPAVMFGGLGRETDVHHVDVMNGVDDGIQIQGGAANFRYLNLWNVGDDSIDIERGWRGQIQFVLIVQGYSADAYQGSGVGDNALELSGARRSDWQPVTTAAIHNATVIGQPRDGDHATRWEDGARVQLRNCILMDVGDAIISELTGSGYGDYGANGTLSFQDVWQTPSSQFSTVNAPANPAAFYRSQLPGMLSEIRDTVMFRNQAPGAYASGVPLGLFSPSNDNVIEPPQMPIAAISRAAPVIVSGFTMLPVIALDPRPANDALRSVSQAPPGGFLAGVSYRGAFGPGTHWLGGWTAADAFGFVVRTAWHDLGGARGGNSGAPVLSATGTPRAGSPIRVELSRAPALTPALLLVSPQRGNSPIGGIDVIPSLAAGVAVPLTTDATGAIAFSLPWPSGLFGTVYWQYAVFDPSAPGRVATSNALVTRQ